MTPPPVSTSTTTTTPDCSEEPLQGFDAVDCDLDLLASIIAQQPSDTPSATVA